MDESRNIVCCVWIVREILFILVSCAGPIRPVYPGRGLYGLVPIILGWSAILLAQPFGCRVRFPGFALGFTEVAVRETYGIARNVLHGTCGGQETPCLNQVVDDRRGGTAKRVHRCFTFLAVGGKSQSTMPLSCQLGQ